MKQCRSCGVEKPFSEFHIRRDNGKHRNDCIECQRCKKNEAQYRDLYGITLSDYDKLYDLQGGVCAMCSLPQIEGRKTRLCVDHCHDTGKVRGLLCTNCNVAIGLLKDDERLLQRGIDYLRSAQS